MMARGSDHDRGARALEAARLAQLPPGRRPPCLARVLSQSEAAERFGLGRGLVQRGRIILDRGTAAEVAAVESGRLTVGRAVQRILEREAAAQDCADKHNLSRRGTEGAGLVELLEETEQERRE